MSRVYSVNISSEKGTVKVPVEEAIIEVGVGIVSDAHSGAWHRQISLLDNESIKFMQEQGKEKGINIKVGDFAENITTEGIDLTKLEIGDILKISDVVLEVTQIGKECHEGCEIMKKVGSCIMPRKGIFTQVVEGGKIKKGDNIEVVKKKRIGVLTLSDKGSIGQREDTSGKLIQEMIKIINGDTAEYSIIPDEKDLICNTLIDWCDNKKLDLILTTGGTGFSHRDITPEATLMVIERHIPGISELIRAEGYKKAKHAILSRGISGIRGNTVIINLPGSKKAVKESLEVILDIIPHGIEILQGSSGECGN
jgi:molybdenum cofactor synthesis domain-containing protein